MKELEGQLGKANDKKETTPFQAGRDFVVRTALHQYWKVGELSPHAQHYFSSRFAPAVCRGEKLSLAETAENLLFGFEFVPNGSAEIPTEGPVVVVGNHWRNGPMRGMWEHGLISKVMRDIRDQEVHWLIQDRLEFLRTGREMPGTAYVNSLLAKTFDGVVITAPFKIERAKRKGRRDNFKFPVRAIRELRSGGVIGCYPEASTSESLIQAWEGSRVLVRGLSKLQPDTKVVPVGGFSKEKHLFLNFGQPFLIGDALKSEARPQDVLMYQIATLLPRELRGYYGGISSR